MEVGGWNVEYEREREMIMVSDCACFMLSSAQLYITSSFKLAFIITSALKIVGAGNNSFMRTIVLSFSLHVLIFTKTYY